MVGDAPRSQGTCLGGEARAFIDALGALSSATRDAAFALPLVLAFASLAPAAWIAMSEDTPRASSSAPYPPPALSNAPSGSSLKVRSPPCPPRSNLTPPPRATRTALVFYLQRHSLQRKVRPFSLSLAKYALTHVQVSGVEREV